MNTLEIKNLKKVLGDIQDVPIVDRPGEYAVKYETKTSSIEEKFTAIPCFCKLEILDRWIIIIF